MPHPLISVRNGIFLLGTVAIALLAGQSAVSQVYPNSTPSRWAAFSATDGEGLSQRFDRGVVDTEGSIQHPARWSKSALTVLRHNPLEAKAIRILALSDLDRDRQTDRARARMFLAERISARDLIGQLWLLEDGVTRGDVKSALQHYDRALSVHPESKVLLFPVLTGAIADPVIRTALAPYLRARRSWAYEFLGTAVDKAAKTADAADLLAKTGGSRAVPSYRPIETMMLNRLIEKGEIILAKRYAEGMAAGPSARKALNEFSFSQATMAPDLRPFTWSFVEDLVLESDYTPGEGLDVKAAGATSGVAADRVMTLQPGQWRFTQSVRLPRLEAGALASWTVTCLTADNGVRPLVKVAAPEEPGDHSLATTIDIAPDCRATRFRLTVRGRDEQEDSSVTIRSVGLSRL